MGTSSDLSLNSLTWLDSDTESLWGPRLQQLQRLYVQLQALTVYHGVRKCCIIHVAPEQWEDVSASVREANASINVLDRTRSGNGYKARLEIAEVGEPFNYWAVVGQNANLVELFSDAYKRGDSQTQGFLLGYPLCCRKFFIQWWDRQGLIDFALPMARNTRSMEMRNSSCCVSGPFQCNSMLRWIGVTPNFHLPCSFDCRSTVQVVSKIMTLAEDLGYVPEMEWTRELLRLPFSWHSEKGVATVKTRLFVMKAKTDESTSGHEVKWVPKSLPPEIPSWEEDNWFFEDNGFQTRDDMNTCHKAIAAVAERVVKVVDGRLLDTGCGNGALAAKIARRGVIRHIVGVDINPTAIGHAKEKILKDFDARLYCADMFDAPEIVECVEYDLVLIDLERFMETPPSRSRKLVRFLHTCGKKMLGYHYKESIRPYVRQMQAHGLELCPFELEAPNVRLLRVKSPVA